MFVDDLQAGGEILRLLLAPVDASHEEPDEPAQRVLIHRVDVGEIADGEEEHRVVRAAGLVPLSRLFNLRLGLVRHLLLLGDFVRDDLRLGEHLDGGGVLQDVPLGRAERVQDAILNLLQPSLVLRGRHHELLSLRLEVRALLGDDDAEQLIG